MMEIAISLAIVGFALVAIIAALTQGMNPQKDNREQTVINQDATVFIEAIRNGSRGADDLTNYVYAVTNFYAQFNSSGQMNAPQPAPNGYDYSASSTTPQLPINDGTNIIGLLSTPEFTDDSGNPTNNVFSGGYSNHIVAYVRSISGPAVEKPPQDNQLLQQDSFGYRILCVNAPVATDPNANSPYNRQLGANLHELRLTFRYPTLPNGGVGNQPPLTFRALISGQIVQINYFGQPLYFYQPQSFTSAP
jgi:type II secretory pathway pseudopilin PulG